MYAPFLYAPAPPESYHVVGLPSCEVRSIQSLDRWQGIWNLFWLSTPSIDKIPAAGADWWTHHSPNVDGMKALVTDVTLDEVLYRRVISHPRKFSEWWSRQDASIYDCHAVFGDAWAETVLSRAYEANLRLRIQSRPPVANQTGMAQVLPFRRKAA